MVSIDSLLGLAHLAGVALAVGAATVKLALVLRAWTEPSSLPAFLAVRRPVTRVLVAGIALAVLSGVGWMVRGYPFTPRLVVKLAVVAAILLLGPLIDRVLEPRLERAAAATQELLAAQRAHLVVECVATLLLYAALALGAGL